MEVRHLSHKTESIDTSLDRQNLAILRKRFLRINADRFHRMNMALNHQQTVFINALPLLFHCNHPMLPGFVSHSTPHGVSEYKPSKSDLSYAKALARSFCLKGGYAGDDIWGIYLMGSVGTLAQSYHSDFDVWLCHKPGLSSQALKELEKKCTRISQWAESQRLEVHFFLMNSEAFRQGQQLTLDDESSGTAQRLLLLDEFYRTAIYICGRMPLWWFCEATEEHHYSKRAAELLDKRFIRPNTTLDFGAIHKIPAGEFLGAGIWQLYKAISSPYKSVLKLLLMEAYVHDYPNIAPLSLEYKQLIYQGDLQVNNLDPYILAYRRIEKYLLSQGDHARLELVRRCLYFKVNKPLSKPSKLKGKSWQRQLLENLTQSWGWSTEFIQFLDQRKHWKALQVKEERSQLVHALNHSYDLLTEFAQKQGSERSISNEELHVLGRKLQAAFEKRPGKLDWINPGISANISEDRFTFIETISTSESGEKASPLWQLFGSESGEDSPLRQANSPVDILLWCHLNRLIDGHAHIDVKQTKKLNESQVRRCLNRLQNWLPNPGHNADHDAFKHRATPTHALILINVGAEVHSPYGEHVHRLSDHSDPFEYGTVKENLVASLDLVVRNNWQEITCHRFSGPNALLNALTDYVSLCMPNSYHAPPQLEVDCIGHSHASLISQRVRQWFHEITNCYYGGNRPPSTRFIFSISGQYHSMQFRGAKLTIKHHTDEPNLLAFLKEPQKRFSPICVDSHALKNHPVRIIARKSLSNTLKIYFQRKDTFLDTWISDEKGSLTRFSLDYNSNLNSLNALHLFIRKILPRLHQAHTPAQDNFGIHPIEFHELRADSSGTLRLSPKVVPPSTENLAITGLVCTVNCDQQGQFQYDFEIENQRFEWHQLGPDVFYVTAQFILKLRRGRERYPVFLTDLELGQGTEQLSPHSDVQLTHYLLLKMEIEKQLSKAIRTLKIV